MQLQKKKKKRKEKKSTLSGALRFIFDGVWYSMDDSFHFGKRPWMYGSVSDELYFLIVLSEPPV